MDYCESTDYFASLCGKYGLPVPNFRMCAAAYDYTTAEEVAFGHCGAGRTKQDVAHLFGHWVCDLHSSSDERLQDKIADLLGGLLTQAEGV